MKYFKTMEKKSKDCFGCYKKVYDKFPETRTFIDKAYSEECFKEYTSFDEVFLTLITRHNVTDFLCISIDWFL